MSELDQPATVGNLYGLGAIILAFQATILMAIYSEYDETIMMLVATSMAVFFFVMSRAAWYDGTCRKVVRAVGSDD